MDIPVDDIKIFSWRLYKLLDGDLLPPRPRRCCPNGISLWDIIPVELFPSKCDSDVVDIVSRDADGLILPSWLSSKRQSFPPPVPPLEVEDDLDSNDEV